MSITQKRVYDKLFSHNSKVEKTSLKRNHKVSLGVAQDLQSTVSNYANTLDTAQKVIDIAIKVNSKIDSLTDDVRYYNKYSAITYEDLERNIEFVSERIEKLENSASELGVDVEKIHGYSDAKNFIIEAKAKANKMNNNPLLFDI